MRESSYALEDTTIHYAQTTPNELLGRGYTIKNLATMNEDNAPAECDLYKNGAKVAQLGFFSVPASITLQQLESIPIDFVTPPRTVPTKKQALRNRIFVTILVHLICAGVLCLIFLVPSLLNIVRAASFRGTQGMLGIIIILMPALINTFIWGGIEPATTGKRVAQKFLLTLWFIFNFAVSFGYFILIGNTFGW